MGLLRTITLNAAQAVNLEFLAQGIVIANATGFWVFVSIGGNIPPTANANDLACPPYTYIASPVPASTKFALSLSLTTQGFTASQAIFPAVTFYESPVQHQVANIQNPNVVVPAASTNNLVTNINPGQIINMIPAVPGQAVQVFRIQGDANVIPSPTSTYALFTFLFWDGVGTQVRIGARSIPPNANGAGPMTPYDWTPNGNRGATGQGLYVGFTAGTGFLGYLDLSTMYIQGQ